MPVNLYLLVADLSFILPFEIIVLLNRVELLKLSNVDCHHCLQHLEKNIVICHLEILHYHLFSGLIAIAIEIANYMYSCQVLIVVVLA